MDYGTCGASWHQYPVDIKGQLSFGGAKSYMWIFFYPHRVFVPLAPCVDQGHLHCGMPWTG